MRPIRILLTQGFADWEVGLILGAQQFFDGLQVTLHSPHGGPVTSLGGMQLIGLSPFDPAPQDIAVICGGTIWETPDAPDLAGRLRDHRAAGGTIAAICGAVLVLARGGLLADVAHVSNGADWLAHWAPGYSGSDRQLDQPQAHADGGIITAAGTAPLSFAVAVLRAAGAPEDGLTHIHTMFAAESRA